MELTVNKEDDRVKVTTKMLLQEAHSVVIHNMLGEKYVFTSRLGTRVERGLVARELASGLIDQMIRSWRSHLLHDLSAMLEDSLSRVMVPPSQPVGSPGPGAGAPATDIAGVVVSGSPLASASRPGAPLNRQDD